MADSAATSEVEASRAEVDIGACSWQHSHSFMLKLACLATGADGVKRAPVEHLVDMRLHLSEDYTITGFQEEDESSDGEGLIEVNSCFFLSMAAEAMGTVLGFPFHGLRVRRLVGKEERDEVTQLLAPGRRAQYHNFRRGLIMEDLEHSEFKNFLRERKETLGLVSRSSSKGSGGEDHIAITPACFLKREFFDGAHYNWAAFKARHVMTMLKSGKLVSASPMSLLLRRYVEAVAPAVRRIWKELKAVPMERARACSPVPPTSLRRLSGRLRDKEARRAANASAASHQKLNMSPRSTSVGRGRATRLRKLREEAGRAAFDASRGKRGAPLGRQSGGYSCGLEAFERDYAYGWGSEGDCKEEPFASGGEEELMARGHVQEAEEGVHARLVTSRSRKTKKTKKRKHKGQVKRVSVELRTARSRDVEGTLSMELMALRDERNACSKLALDFAKRLVDLQDITMETYQQSEERIVHRGRQLEQETREFEEAKERFLREFEEAKKAFLRKRKRANSNS